MDVRNNKSIDKSKVTINHIQDLLLENESKQNLIKESTQVRNKQTALVISKMYIADMPIQKVSVDQIEDCLTELIDNYSNSSIDKTYLKLAAIFRKARKIGIIKEDPFAEGDVTKPKSKKEDRKVEAFTIEEQQAFMKQLASKEYCHRTNTLLHDLYRNANR